MGSYNTAQVCLNGHVIIDTYESNPQLGQRYCGKCGEKTITTCPSCSYKIRGDYEVNGVTNFSSDEPKVDSYCYNCGQPYPWTEEKLNSANDLLALEDSLSEKELEYFKENLNSVLVDTPKTKLVATKLKLAMSQSSSVVGSALRDIFVDIASEAAKKILFPE